MELGGLAKYNLNVACAYYILLEKSKQYEDSKYSKKGKNVPETNFGMMPNTKKTI